jgi:3'-phosphoadenosine 5'-phosphosulfate sulfotransferase (PAPS reductase)/FAD synthetase
MTARDPFLIDGPACISFSGGRTSGYMLWRVLQAHGGRLPGDVVVCFCNTGKEMPETLDFVQACSERWSVPITWLEYAGKHPETGKKGFAIVTHATASRNGEPFATLIAERGYLPNPVARFCTVELKIRPKIAHLRSLGWTDWINAVGIRADEPRRVAKIRARPSTETPGEEMSMPLADAGITAESVGAFWREAPFDLMLPNINGRTMHGNCDLCFLKGASINMALIRERPDRALWWMAQEQAVSNATKKPGGARFHADNPSYAQMHRMATHHGELFAFDDAPLDDCACTD